MQAKAVVVVEWVCGTLHTDTTGENTTWKETESQRTEIEILLMGLNVACVLCNKRCTYEKSVGE